MENAAALHNPETLQKIDARRVAEKEEEVSRLKAQHNIA